jgi:lysyl-tRNA synthetase class I
VALADRAARHWQGGDPAAAQAEIYKLKERARYSEDYVSRYAPSALASVLSTLTMAEEEHREQETSEDLRAQAAKWIRTFRDALNDRNTRLLYSSLLGLESLAYVAESDPGACPVDS